MGKMCTHGEFPMEVNKSVDIITPALEQSTNIILIEKDRETHPADL